MTIIVGSNLKGQCDVPVPPSPGQKPHWHVPHLRRALITLNKPTTLTPIGNCTRQDFFSTPPKPGLASA